MGDAVKKTHPMPLLAEACATERVARTAQLGAKGITIPSCPWAVFSRIDQTQVKAT